MRTGGVIQGFFPNGLSRVGAVQPMGADAGRPEWVQRSIGASRVPAAVQRHAAPQPAAVPGAIPLPPNLSRLGAGTGQPLPGDVRQRMEAVFGTSFADVRVHVGPEATSLGALAFTHGSNIHFAQGHYNPTMPRGLQILGHELAHVVQQRAGRVRNPFGSGIAVVHSAALEAEADRMGQRAVASWRVPRPHIVQRARRDEYKPPPRGAAGGGGGGGGAGAPARPKATHPMVKRGAAAEMRAAGDLYAWADEIQGTNYMVIAMVKNKDRISEAKELSWESIDHAVICFQGECYGWGVQCMVEKGADGIYATKGKHDWFWGSEITRTATHTLTWHVFWKRTDKWMKMVGDGKAIYPYNCRGYVDYVLGIVRDNQLRKSSDSDGSDSDGEVEMEKEEED